jgi:hypothetical protein
MSNERLVECGMQTRVTVMPEKLPNMHGDLLLLLDDFVMNIRFKGWALAALSTTAVWCRVFSFCPLLDF